MTKIQFSRKQLCIPYAVFLALFVIVPMLLILFYAFTGTDGRFTFENFLNFFTSTAKLSTLLMSFTIAIIMLAGIREKIEHNDVPYSFQGSPIVLITSGLMAIAFFGFSGLI